MRGVHQVVIQFFAFVLAPIQGKKGRAIIEKQESGMARRKRVVRRLDPDDWLLEGVGGRAALGLDVAEEVGLAFILVIIL